MNFTDSLSYKCYQWCSWRTSLSKGRAMPWEPKENAREQFSPGDRPLEGNTATRNGTATPTGALQKLYPDQYSWSPLCPELLVVQNLTQTAEFTEWHTSPDTPVWLLWPYCTFCDTQSPPENTRPSTPKKLETYTNLYRHSSFLFSCRRLKCHTWTSKLWVYNSPGLLILKPFYQSIPKPPLPGWLSMIVFEDIHMCKLNQNSTVGFT